METRAVLFVDDEPGLLNSLKRIFRTEPYESFFAGGGKEALDLLKKENIHVIVTDLTMQEMDGQTLLKKVKQTHPDIIRLVLSVHDDRDSILDATNTGNVYRYILKPWDNTELKLTVRQAIEVFNLQQEKRDLLKELEEQNNLLEKRVQERTSQLMAIESHAEIGKYASQIVHDLNSPIQAIMGGVELSDMEMAEEVCDLKKICRYFDIIRSQAHDLEKIISTILMHARDKTLYKREQIAINEVIKKELNFFKLDPIFKYKVDKHLELSDNLPYVVGNPVQMKQIIDNLVKNAIDAMEHSQEKRLSVETRVEDNTVTIRISDTGEGIAEEDLGRIFSPDFTTKPIGKGTGLGLASVKTMVESYSGDIRVESTKGKGTTFIVNIPMSAA